MILEGDCVDVLRDLDAGSVQTCVTSPPYWGLRDYGTATWTGGETDCDHLAGPLASDKNKLGGGKGQVGDDYKVQAFGMPFRGNCGKCGAKRIDSQLGLEPTPEEYVANLVEVFREVRRVLRDDGTVWLNLGDSYANPSQSGGGDPTIGTRNLGGKRQPKVGVPGGLKPKDLVGIPWRVAFALQADGWWLRSDIIWSKPNPMPESVTDRPTQAHEYVFLLSKAPRYFYDADAIREPSVRPELIGKMRLSGVEGLAGQRGDVGRQHDYCDPAGRNRRSVWEIATQPYSEAHFATFPPKLVEPCVLAGSPPKCCGECGASWERVTVRQDLRHWRERRSERDKWDFGQEHGRNDGGGSFPGDDSVTTGWRSTCDHDDDSASATVLDPFCGAGTTGLVATQHGRDFIGIELNPEYAEMARERIRRYEANPAGYLEKVESVLGQISLLE